jgi:hypothetical protein
MTREVKWQVENVLIVIAKEIGKEVKEILILALFSTLSVKIAVKVLVKNHIKHTTYLGIAKYALC